MLKFAGICPHPPIIIPTIGSPFDLEKVRKTILAMEKLAEIFTNIKPETLIIISPHGPVSYQEMTITISPTLSGNFQNFGDYQTEMEFKNDLEIIDLLYKECKKGKQIPVQLAEKSFLDHGTLVPLYYLSKKITPKVVPIAYSFLDTKIHFEFGKKIQKICDLEEKIKKKKIAIVASGDLSHRLTFEAPAGFSIKGAEFDEKLVKLLKNNKRKEILNMDPNLIKEAGECGYLSIIILLGALSNKRTKFKFLSYQGPFGVGYLVGYFSL